IRHDGCHARPARKQPGTVGAGHEKGRTSKRDAARSACALLAGTRGLKRCCGGA
ncbi:hypothetical protein COLINT_03366, partial [Collinsella intestinalis DSM 13280]